MQYAQKMLLVPSGALKEDPFPHPQKQIVSGLDGDMNSILARKDLDDSSKWRLYEQTLQRYTNLHTIAKQPKQILLENAPKSGSNVAWMDDIPLRYIASVQKLVDQIENIPDRLRWTANGEVIVNNSVVSGSDIRDIALEFVRPTSNVNTKPRGFYAVSNLLAQLAPLGFQSQIKTQSTIKSRLPHSNIPLLINSKPQTKKKAKNTQSTAKKVKHIGTPWLAYNLSPKL